MIFWQKFLNLLEFRNCKNCWGSKIFLRLKNDNEADFQKVDAKKKWKSDDVNKTLIKQMNWI